VPGPPHRVRWVDRHDLAVDQPVEQMPQRGEPPLYRGCRKLARRRLDPRCDMHGLDGGDRSHASARAPGQELLDSPVVGPSGLRVAAVGGEELEEAGAGALAGDGDQCRQGRGANRDELIALLGKSQRGSRGSLACHIRRRPPCTSLDTGTTRSSLPFPMTRRTPLVLSMAVREE
jgi:hypothetical protein